SSRRRHTRCLSDWSSDVCSSDLGGSATIWAVAGTFTGPLFNAGRTLGTYRASVAQWEQAKLQYEGVVLNALREVSDALTALAKRSEERRVGKECGQRGWVVEGNE